MLEAIVVGLIVVSIAGVVGSAFIRPKLYHQKIYPLVYKAGVLIFVFGLGFGLGRESLFEQINWGWFFYGGLLIQFGSLVLDIFSHEVEADN